MNSKIAFLFDVDGVIADPKTRTLTKPQIVEHIINRLQRSIPVSIISGRAMPWLRERILKVFEDYIESHSDLSKQILDNLYVSAEFGGIEAVYQNGQRKESFNQEVELSKKIFDALQKIGVEFKHYAFIDQEKQTHFTLEANIDDNNDFGTHKNEIADALKTVIADNAELEVHIDRLSVNVKNKKANKKYSTVQFLKWLQEKEYKVEKYYVFGDAVSDFEMGYALREIDAQFEFIFTGDEDEIDTKNLPFTVTVTKGHCDEGTLEFLNSQRT